MTLMDLELLVILFSLIYCVAIPVYLLYREKMTGSGILDYFAGFFPKQYQRLSLNNHKRKQDYGKKRILKLTAFNLLGNSVLAAFAVLVLLIINPIYSPLSWGLILVTFFLICLTYYGAGIYITTIVIEAYTKISLRRIYSFKTQFLGISLFHGAVSHFFVCAGWIGVIAVLGIMDFLVGVPKTVQSPILVIGCGAAFALFTSIGQVVNKTAMVQLFSATITYLIFFAVLILTSSQLSTHTMGMFAASILFFYNVMLVEYVTRNRFSK